MKSKANEKEFSRFEDYVENLHKYIYASNTISKLKLVLDGEPSRQYRNQLSIQLRRESGAFFSSQHLANEIFKSANKYLSQNSRIIDPTCGIGNLLLPFAAQISIGANFDKTIDLINSKIVGYDNNPVLINTTKIRLLLLAKLINRLLGPIQIDPISIFSNIKEQDFFNINFNFKKSDIIVFNPPFGHIKTDETINWGSGKIQLAALFTSKLLEITEPDQNIFAILPDVLRSGTRYIKWRNTVAMNSSIVSIKPYGRFDKYTDVDVFILHLQKRKNKSSISSWPVVSEIVSQKTVGDYFNISIGSVVPHRSTEGNEEVYFINTKNTSRWGKLKSKQATLIRGTKHEAPFIVVRRTSSPNDIFRAVPTLIVERGQFVIENHLLILKPKCGTLNKCKQLIELLKDHRTNDWLNNYIRCRHLTKKSLLELPWWE